VSALLGLSVIALTAAVTGAVVEDVTDGHGSAVLDQPVAAFVAARRTGALTAVMGGVSAAGGQAAACRYPGDELILIGIKQRAERAQQEPHPSARRAAQRPAQGLAGHS